MLGPVPQGRDLYILLLRPAHAENLIPNSRSAQVCPIHLHRRVEPWPRR